MIPTLDLHGTKHEEVENEVARFLSLWMGKNLFADIITGHSETMSNLVLQVVTAYGLEYMTGLPAHPGRIRVVLYDELN
jgi:hypothetical protein